MNQMDHIKIAAGIIEAGAHEEIIAADNVEDKFRVAFREAHDYWMSTDEDIRFKGGIGAVMISIGVDHPDYDRIAIELDQLKVLSAAMSGVPVDFDAIAAPDDFKPIGIIKLWKEK